ncbi:MAG: hypothetical protein DME48_09690, partial [Verrucomicrobia bacterium]
MYDQPLLKLSAWQANCRTNRCRASASLAVRDQQAERPTSVAYHQPGLLAAADARSEGRARLGLAPRCETAGRIVTTEASRACQIGIMTGFRNAYERPLRMKPYLKILFSILAAAICTVGFAADKPSC